VTEGRPNVSPIHEGQASTPQRAGRSLALPSDRLVIIVAVQGLGFDYSSLIAIPGLVGVWVLIRYLHAPRQIFPRK